jgi:hypothetical protein
MKGGKPVYEEIRGAKARKLWEGVAATRKGVVDRHRKSKRIMGRNAEFNEKSDAYVGYKKRIAKRKRAKGKVATSKLAAKRGAKAAPAKGKKAKPKFAKPAKKK